MGVAEQLLTGGEQASYANLVHLNTQGHLTWKHTGYTVLPYGTNGFRRLAAEVEPPPPAVPPLLPPPPPSSPAPCREVVNATREFSQIFDYYDKELAGAKQATGLVDPPSWTSAGALFFVFTVVTTIGYGTFSPTTRAGKYFVVYYGYAGMAVGGIFLGMYGDALGALTSKLAPLGWLGGGRLRPRLGKPELLMRKAALSALLLFPYMLLASSFATDKCAVDPDDGFYYAFQTFSTIGFGDLTCGVESYGGTVLQLALILPGLLLFNIFMDDAGNLVRWILDAAIEALTGGSCSDAGTAAGVARRAKARARRFAALSVGSTRRLSLAQKLSGLGR